MRKIILLTALATLLSARPAAACRNGQSCPFIIDFFGYALLGAMVGGYAYGTGYFAYRDLTDDQQSIGYGAGEVAFNGIFGSFATWGVIDSVKHGRVGSTVIYGSLAAAHGTMAVHGAWRIHAEWKDWGHAPDNTREWIGGIAYGANTLVWTMGLRDDHGRTYGIVEAGVNAPIAAGLTYLAIDRARDRERGPALVYGGMAALSAAFTYHGLRHAIDPDEPRALDLLGTDLMPVAVSDGREVAPGLAMSGTW